METKVKVDNYVVNTPLIDILYKVKSRLSNGKLREIRMTSSGISVTCPFHANGHEHDNSCYVDPTTGIFNCFSCNESGTLAKFISGCFDSSYDYAKNWIINNYGVKAYSTLDLGEPIVLNKSKKKQVVALDESLLDNYQHYCPYLAKRKLPIDICEKFNIRYDSFNRQVIFPVYDDKNNLVMLAKRNIDFKHFVLPSDIEKPLYCYNVIKNNNIKTFLIVEGLIDVLTCWSHGVPAVATLGNVSEEQLKTLKKSNACSLYLATDNDRAGDLFANKIECAMPNSIFTTRVVLPKNRKDVNDLTNDEWNDLIKKYNLPKVENF